MGIAAGQASTKTFDEDNNKKLTDNAQANAQQHYTSRR